MYYFFDVCVKIYPPSLILFFTCTLNAISVVNFEIVEGAFSWEDAKLDAESRGGTLAILDTEEKMTQAYDYYLMVYMDWILMKLFIGLKMIYGLDLLMKLLRRTFDLCNGSSWLDGTTPNSFVLRW